jgi:thiamine-monophosphate kinase
MTLPNILGKEFVCINKIMRSLPVGGAIGDDCAVISWGGKNLLVSVDTFVEKVHFDLRYFELHEVGERCAEASLSDIAAMGGKALYATLSLSVPDHKMIEAVTKGVKRSLTRHKVKLVGGDTTFSSSVIVSFTVMGEASKPVYRSGAKFGDSVCVSSYTGLSYGGFHALKNKIKGFDVLKAKHKTPKARLDIAQKISRSATSMIDISDGLVSELYHLAHASGVSIVIDHVPLHAELKRLARTSKNHKHDPKIMALYGGEDFELLYTIPNKRAIASGIKIGNVIRSKGKPAVYIKTTGGNIELLPPDIGFKHFI